MTICEFCEQERSCFLDQLCDNFSRESLQSCDAVVSHLSRMRWMKVLVGGFPDGLEGKGFANLGKCISGCLLFRLQKAVRTYMCVDMWRAWPWNEFLCSMCPQSCLSNFWMTKEENKIGVSVNHVHRQSSFSLTLQSQIHEQWITLLPWSQTEGIFKAGKIFVQRKRLSLMVSINEDVLALTKRFFSWLRVIAVLWFIVVLWKWRTWMELVFSVGRNLWRFWLGKAHPLCEETCR